MVSTIILQGQLKDGEEVVVNLSCGLNHLFHAVMSNIMWCQIK